MFCVSSSSLNLIWNGEIVEPFASHRALRQGDILLPYLFVLCIEKLYLMIEKLTMTESGSLLPDHEELLNYLICSIRMILFSK